MKRDPLPTEYENIFRKLSPETLALLNQCYEGLKNKDPEGSTSDSYIGSASTLFVLITGQHAQFGTGVDDYMLADGTIRQAMDLGLIDGSFAIPGERNSDMFYMTRLGKEFVRACRAAGRCEPL
jgi:hypothetical protein